ncbi:Membrane protein insertase YidC [Nymphon striatum]|nr:Membrane protein insertase YidC [Nymphon striatum]
MLMLYQNQPSEEEIAAEKAKQEQVDAQTNTDENKVQENNVAATPAINLQDSTAVANYKSNIGAFGFTVPSEGTTKLENDLVYLEISNKGGQIIEARMKQFHTYDSIPIYLVKDGNALFALNFSTSDNRVLNTKDLYFEPSMSQNGDNQVLSMKAKVAADKYLEYRYEMKPDDYLVDFTLRSQGLNGIINTGQPIELEWKLKGIRHNKSITYENRYTRLTYSHEDNDIDKLSEGSDDDETEVDIKWLSYRQHFFSSILANKDNFDSAALTSVNLVEEESKTAAFTKEYNSIIPLKMDGGELSQNLHWYYGPTDIAVLSKYEELNLEDSIPFGWVERLVPFLSPGWAYGIAVVVMTILVRLAMSPVTYKSYLSQAKMKVLKPEIAELAEKYKDNAMKKQQETMKLNRKAGVNPMSGIMLVIKNFIIDNDKIHAQIQENKLKPKKENKFQKKMREMMEQAEEQKKKK